LKVNIFGTEYPLKVSADVNYIESVAKYVDEKMREIQAIKPNRPLHQIAILAALNITDELLKQKDLSKNGNDDFEVQVNNLAKKLESVTISAEEDV
jgi:cell division protein ZapA